MASRRDAALAARARDWRADFKKAAYAGREEPPRTPVPSVIDKLWANIRNLPPHRRLLIAEALREKAALELKNYVAWRLTLDNRA
jgi:hypothetical protein